MCLFTKGRKALVAVLDLALHEVNGPVSLPAISERTGLSLSYLESIFRKLRVFGIVLTIRGAHGGFILARTTAELTVADVMMAIGESSILLPVAVEGEHRQRKLCRKPGKSALQLGSELNKRLLDYCQTISIKELVEEGEGSGRSFSMKQIRAQTA
ncbi:MAG TPA: Rrf2 family transcriptional regulator [Noviherbaspirillum sp.]